MARPGGVKLDFAATLGSRPLARALESEHFHKSSRARQPVNPQAAVISTDRQTDALSDT